SQPCGVCQWFGPGSIDGQVQFSQAVPQGPTTIQVSLKNLASIAGGYHVHVLPLKPGSASPCSNADILGHFNPLAWNVSNSPSPGVGTVDQYEVGDISGKFGMLTLKDIYEGVHEDPSMPLTGPYSIVGRSLVIHHTNSTSDTGNHHPIRDGHSTFRLLIVLTFSNISFCFF
uniref:Superoxide dismutase copper/zinc binding domain-containing protein n=1 Tax=Oryzias latipes TaxID=8090 RepID=A0A3P9MGJ2_ORYLA